MPIEIVAEGVVSTAEDTVEQPMPLAAQTDWNNNSAILVDCGAWSPTRSGESISLPIELREKRSMTLVTTMTVTCNYEGSKTEEDCPLTQSAIEEVESGLAIHLTATRGVS